MIKPSFIPPADIRQLRDLVRYRTKLTDILTGEKNRALNCLTVSNLKLDDVFSDVFGKSSRSIISYILEHPGQSFDVTPFVDKHCKKPIEEIQAAVDGAISREQAAKLKECLRHIDEIRAHKQNIELEIQRLAEPYAYALELLRTIPGLIPTPLPQFLSFPKLVRICPFSQLQNILFPGQDVVPVMTKAILRLNPPVSQEPALISSLCLFRFPMP